MAQRQDAQRQQDLISMRDYVDMRIDALEAISRMLADGNLTHMNTHRSESEVVAKAIEVRFRAIDQATDLAAAAIERRLESMNEFRQQLNDQAAKFITRTEMDDKIRAREVAGETNEKRVQALEKQAANMDGRIWAVSVAFTVISTLIGIGLHFIK